MKKALVILLITAIVSIIFIAFGVNSFPAIGFGLLIAFLIYGLWNPPRKYKTYSLTDQQESAHRALGGHRLPDASDIEPPMRNKRKENKSATNERKHEHKNKKIVNKFMSGYRRYFNWCYLNEYS